MTFFENFKEFFITFIGEEFYTNYENAFIALVIGFSLMILYGLLIRPLLSLCIVKNKGFFDIVMILLIVLVIVKITFPGMFAVDGFTQEDLDKHYDIGYSDGYDLGEAEGYDKGYADADSGSSDVVELIPFPSMDVLFSYFYGLYDSTDEDFPYVYMIDEFNCENYECRGTFYTPMSEVLISDGCGNFDEVLQGEPYIDIWGTTWYRYIPPAEALESLGCFQFVNALDCPLSDNIIATFVRDYAERDVSIGGISNVE